MMVEWRGGRSEKVKTGKAPKEARRELGKARRVAAPAATEHSGNKSGVGSSCRLREVTNGFWPAVGKDRVPKQANQRHAARQGSSEPDRLDKRGTVSITKVFVYVQQTSRTRVWYTFTSDKCESA